MSDILQEIVSRLKTDLLETKKKISLAALEKQIAGTPTPHDFAAAFISNRSLDAENPDGVPSNSPGLPERSAGYPGCNENLHTTPTGLCQERPVIGHNPGGVVDDAPVTRGSSLCSQPRAMRLNPVGVLNSGKINIIAEIKKASPSKGVIRENFNPLELALELEKSGAAALSVLTEPHRFLGNLEYLRQITGAVKIPVLRKDFIFDPYQIYEARAAGASAVLLIAAMLGDKELRALAGTAHALGLSVLGEAHDAEELSRLLDSPADLIGVNARNLKTFKTDLNITAELIGKIPAARRPIAESAIRTRDDILKLRAAGAAGFLIGETLMRAESPGEKLKELLHEN